jgi:exodeoxyribonuclease V alpha subunit
VVIPLATQHYMLLQRNLIYTGITRGKKLVSATCAISPS